LKNLLLTDFWYHIYELLENLYYHQVIYYVRLNSFSEDERNFTENLNFALKKYGSGYTLINGQFIAVTNEEEINEIENLSNNINKFKLENVGKHYKIALDLFAQKPDIKYSKVIHECMCMVEGICIFIEPKTKTLGDALKRLKKSGFDLHPSLNEAFEKLYGFASDAGGIRHSHKLDEIQNLDIEDARFFLIACSAFTNYLISKSQKAGIIRDN
jgi:hypothetical protein